MIIGRVFAGKVGYLLCISRKKNSFCFACQGGELVFYLDPWSYKWPNFISKWYSSTRWFNHHPQPVGFWFLACYIMFLACLVTEGSSRKTWFRLDRAESVQGLRSLSFFIHEAVVKAVAKPHGSWHRSTVRSATGRFPGIEFFKSNDFLL